MNTPKLILVEKLHAAFSMWSEFVAGLDGRACAARLATIRSNTIGQQLWCLGGCRESNLRALQADRPFAWHCSYDGRTDDCEQIAAYVNDMAARLTAFLDEHEQLSELQWGLLFDLYAHEYQHQGQVIRYLYGNGMTIPQSWQQFWHLEA